MTIKEKIYLAEKVRFFTKEGFSKKEIIIKLLLQGYKKSTVENYVKALSK